MGFVSAGVHEGSKGDGEEGGSESEDEVRKISQLFERETSIIDTGKLFSSTMYESLPTIQGLLRYEALPTTNKFFNYKIHSTSPLIFPASSSMCILTINKKSAVFLKFF